MTIDGFQVKALAGRQASIVTAEGNTVTAVLVGVDRYCTYVILQF